VIGTGGGLGDGGRGEKKEVEGTRISTRGQALGKRGKMRRARGTSASEAHREAYRAVSSLPLFISHSLDINHSRYFPPLSRELASEYLE
jgi:hypothetical protein